MECPILLAVDTTENWERSGAALGKSELAIELYTPDATKPELKIKRLLIGDGKPVGPNMARLRATAEQLAGLPEFILEQVGAFGKEMNGKLEKEAADRDAAIGRHDKDPEAHVGIWQAVGEEAGERAREDKRLEKMINLLGPLDGDLSGLLEVLVGIAPLESPAFTGAPTVNGNSLPVMVANSVLADCNNPDLLNGSVYWYGNATLNRPTNSGWLITYAPAANVSGIARGQLAFGWQGDIYIRSSSGSGPAWSAWQRLPRASDIEGQMPINARPIAANADVNSLPTGLNSCSYNTNVSGISNRPFDSPFHVLQLGMEGSQYGGRYTQIAFELMGGGIKWRGTGASLSNWTDWQECAATDSPVFKNSLKVDFYGQAESVFNAAVATSNTVGSELVYPVGTYLLARVESTPPTGAAPFETSPYTWRACLRVPANPGPSDPKEIVLSAVSSAGQQYLELSGSWVHFGFEYNSEYNSGIENGVQTGNSNPGIRRRALICRVA